MHFAVGRGSEGGPASCHLAIAGITQDVTEPHWGTVNNVAQNSGCSLGTMQIGFGQRGQLPKRQKVPGEGGGCEALRAKAGQIRKTCQYFDVPKAGDITVCHEDACANNKQAMDRIHALVSSRDCSPAGMSTAATIAATHPATRAGSRIRLVPKPPAWARSDGQPPLRG